MAIDVNFDLTGTNSSVGFLTMAAGIPMVLLGPIGVRRVGASWMRRRFWRF